MIDILCFALKFVHVICLACARGHLAQPLGVVRLAAFRVPRCRARSAYLAAGDRDRPWRAAVIALLWLVAVVLPRYRLSRPAPWLRLHRSVDMAFASPLVSPTASCPWRMPLPPCLVDGPLIVAMGCLPASLALASRHRCDRLGFGRSTSSASRQSLHYPATYVHVLVLQLSIGAARLNPLVLTRVLLHGLTMA